MVLESRGFLWLQNCWTVYRSCFVNSTNKLFFRTSHLLEYSLLMLKRKIWNWWSMKWPCILITLRFPLLTFNELVIKFLSWELQGDKTIMVACGWRHTISVSSSGGLYTYGWSKYGQLRHGDFEDHLSPHKVEALRGSSISLVISFPSHCYLNRFFVSFNWNFGSYITFRRIQMHG